VKFSVVTPSFNQSIFVGRTLASVAAQTGVAWDHRVIDGGSADDTVEVLRAARPPVAWTSAPDRGQAHAVNQGIAEARGDVIAWINSDDVYYPGAFERAAAVFAADPAIDVVYGMADHIDVQDRTLDAYPTRAWNAEALERECFVCQPAAFVRRSAFDRFGALDESLRYCMDYELWLRFARGGARFAYLREKLAGSRMHATNKTLGERVAVHAEISAMLRRHLGHVPWRWRVNEGFARAEASHPHEDYLRRRLRVLRFALGARGE
jgi:glycosyltransferase involved in cell wall biosynthesis